MSDDMRAFFHRCLQRLHAESGSTRDADAFTLGEITLLRHQRDGARRLRAILAQHGGALLADEVGLGKTYTALAVARDVTRVLIVAPAAVRTMWQEASTRCGVATTVVTYEQLSAGRMPPATHWELVILDEAHRARSPATRRYRALAQLTLGVPVLLLTATPIHNRRADLDALLALFLGAGSATLDDAALSALVVRRRVEDVGAHLPSLHALRRHEVPPAPAVLEALRTLPPPLPPADGGVAESLVALQLTRAWCSSDAALTSAIRRRLATAAALEHALSCGRLPSRRDLAVWTAATDGSVQLAFPELIAAPAPSADVVPLLEVVRRHAEGLSNLRTLVRGSAARDTHRFAQVRRVLAECADRQSVVFTHSAETAEAAYRALRDTTRAALLTGRLACIASGPVTRQELLDVFAPGDAPPRRRDDIARIDVLVASDVLSEGVDLHGAAVVIHLDLPWTVARFEQRLGRLRRLGSRHDAVEAHLISPPVDAGELALTLHHLARKARLVTTTVGSSSIMLGADAWDASRADGHARAPIASRHAMLRTLQRLERLATALGATPRVTPCVTPAPHGFETPPAGVVDATHITRCQVEGRTTSIALALVSRDGDAHLVIAEGDQVTIEPGRVVATLQALADGFASLEAAGGSVATWETSAARGPLLPIERGLLRWCDQQRAQRQLSPDVAHTSPPHRRLLRALSSVVARAPRGERPAIARRAADGRQLALSCAGAGVESLLDTLVSSAGPNAPDAGGRTAASSPASASPQARADLLWLDRVIAALRHVAPTSSFSRVSFAPDASLATMRIEAILTLLPRDDRSDPASPDHPTVGNRPRLRGEVDA